MIRFGHSLVFVATLYACSAACYASTPYNSDEDEYVIWDIEHNISQQPDSIVGEQILTLNILGNNEVDMASVCRFISRRNPQFETEIAEAFYRLSPMYGIRADIAICQSIVETGWFKYTGGTAVTADQHNYCGLGVTQLGVKGACFDTVDDGVRAQLQHLYAYASKRPIPADEPITDPRFHLVNRGTATTWHDLAGRWAMNPNYGNQIMDIFSLLIESMQENTTK